MKDEEIDYTLGMSYGKFALTHSKEGSPTGNYPFDRKRVLGVFRDKITGKIIEGDNFNCINIHDDAEKSYKRAIDFYNHTLRDDEHEREFVSAKWDTLQEEAIMWDELPKGGNGVRGVGKE